LKLTELKNTAQAFGNIEFLAKQVVEGFITGLHKSPYHGFSVEFAEHRHYNTGESTRHIDWKIYSKTDKLFIKTYEEETNLRCTILLDVSSSMYYPVQNFGKLRFSALAAASIALMLQKQRDAVGLTTFTDVVNYKSAIKSSGIHLNELFTKLSQVFESKEKNLKSSFEGVFHEIAETLHKRSLLIIFSDMFSSNESTESIFNALKHLKHNKHEVLIFNVIDAKTEYNLEFSHRPHEFIDLETNEKVKLNPGQLNTSYKETMDNFLKEFKIKCGQYKIDFIDIDVNEDFEKVLMPFLKKRTKL
jgi:uncharacterized protein (DUF58 family)